MQIPFYKYEGAGNDFILINQLGGEVLQSHEPTFIARLCDRRFGIGADGLILLCPHPEFDFEMVYFNADGRASSLCGNGGRCITAFAHFLGAIGTAAHFLAIDGPHRAKVVRADWVELEMLPVEKVEESPDASFVDTGSPHWVQAVASLDGFDVVTEGRRIRYSERFRERGTNVNFVCGDASQLQIATYERGVEDETLACGTGVTAAAIVAAKNSQRTGEFNIPVSAKGGDLSVRLHYDGRRFSNIWLCGPAKQVFQGSWNNDHQ